MPKLLGHMWLDSCQFPHITVFSPLTFFHTSCVDLLAAGIMLISVSKHWPLLDNQVPHLHYLLLFFFFWEIGENWATSSKSQRVISVSMLRTDQRGAKKTRSDAWELAKVSSMQEVPSLSLELSLQSSSFASSYHSGHGCLWLPFQSIFKNYWFNSFFPMGC